VGAGLTQPPHDPEGRLSARFSDDQEGGFAPTPEPTDTPTSRDHTSLGVHF